MSVANGRLTSVTEPKLVNVDEETTTGTTKQTNRLFVYILRIDQTF